MIQPRNRAGWPGTTSAAVTLLAQGILLASVVIAPWLFGGVQPEVQIGLLAAAATAILCLLIKQVAVRSTRVILPTALVPLALTVGLGLLQLIPLNRSINGLLSPTGDQFRLAMSFSEPPAENSQRESLGVGAVSQRQPISLYPASTRHDLALLILGAAVFFLGANLFYSPKAQIWLCAVVALNGAALAFFGIVQQLTWKGLLYWNFPLLGGGAPFGPFICRNNAGGFLNLCLAAAVGWLLWLVRRHESSDQSGGRQGWQQKFAPNRIRDRVRDFVMHLNASSLAAMLLTVCIVAGILCSLSRGAFLAMIGAAVLTATVTFCANRRITGGLHFALIAVAGIGLVCYVGMNDAMSSRLATLLNQDALEHSRLPHWKDGMKVIPDFWRLGSGLGTYRYVYGLHQEQLRICWYYHAENQYLETLVECGIPGLVLLLATIVTVAVAGWRLLRFDGDRRRWAFAIAGIFGLSSQLIANSFDLGLYVPSNMVLLALVCGAISGGAAELAGRAPRPSSFLATAGRAIMSLVAPAALAGCVFGVLEIRSFAIVENALRETTFTKSPSEFLPRTVVAKIEKLTQALEFRGDDADGQYTLARLWVFLYRLTAWEELRTEAPIGTDRDSLWPLTSATVIHKQLHQFKQSNRAVDLDALRNSPAVRNNLRPALKHLILARQACPLLPDVHLLAAELCGLVMDPASDAIPLANARRLSPSDPEMLFQIGQLEFQAARTDAAYATWRDSLTLSIARLPETLNIVGPQIVGPSVIEKLLPLSPKLLIQLAQENFQGPEQSEVRRLLADRAEKLIGQVELSEADKHALRGTIYAIRQNYSGAIQSYQLALELRPDNTDWRCELALALWQSGKIDDAFAECRRCVLAVPGNAKYRELLEKIDQVRLNPTGERLK